MSDIRTYLEQCLRQRSTPEGEQAVLQLAHHDPWAFAEQFDGLYGELTEYDRWLLVTTIHLFPNYLDIVAYLLERRDPTIQTFMPPEGGWESPAAVAELVRILRPCNSDSRSLAVYVMTQRPSQKILLHKILERFGESEGRFVSEPGTPGPRLSLAPYRQSSPTSHYLVVQRIDGAVFGKMVPWFGQPGGATQGLLPEPIVMLVRKGLLRPIDYYPAEQVHFEVDRPDSFAADLHAFLQGVSAYGQWMLLSKVHAFAANYSEVVGHLIAKQDPHYRAILHAKDCLDSPSVVDRLIQLLDAGDRSTRVAAARTLASREDLYGSHVLRLIRDNDEAVRSAATSSANLYSCAMAQEEAVRLLSDPSDGVVIAALVHALDHGYPIGKDVKNRVSESLNPELNWFASAIP
jgi:hypothetical protein